jgi:hypothetical protein
MNINFDKISTTLLSDRSVKDVVQSYYSLQKLRLSFSSRSSEMSRIDQSYEIMYHLSDTLLQLENSIKASLKTYSSSTLLGRWSLSQYGIGPVITSGLLTHIDITKAPHASSVWRYAGLDPTLVWEKGKPSPYNTELKSLCYKIGKSFMTFSDKEKCFYGKLYLKDKERRIEKNKQLEDQDKVSLSQIDAQARRYAVKIFLSHYHSVAYQEHYGVLPPPTYPLQKDSHFHEIPIPNNPFKVS